MTASIASPITIHSIYVGRPRTLHDERGTWRSSIYRDRVEGPVELGLRGLAGDQVTDTDNHGSPDQAVCCHPLGHYTFWNARYGLTLRPGNLGENWVLEEADEAAICMDDVYRVGSALVQVSSPRVPCEKQARRVGRADWVKLTLQELRPGFYLRVLEPGLVGAGDRWLLEDRPLPWLSLHTFNRCIYQTFDPTLARRILQKPDLDPYWARILREKISESHVDAA